MALPMGLTQEQQQIAGNTQSACNASCVLGTVPAPELTVGGRRPTNGSAEKEEVAGRRTLSRKWSGQGDSGNLKAPSATTRELLEARNKPEGVWKSWRMFAGPGGQVGTTSTEVLGKGGRG